MVLGRVYCTKGPTFDRRGSGVGDGRGSGVGDGRGSGATRRGRRLWCRYASCTGSRIVRLQPGVEQPPTNKYSRWVDVRCHRRHLQMMQGASCLSVRQKTSVSRIGLMQQNSLPSPTSEPPPNSEHKVPPHFPHLRFINDGGWSRRNKLQATHYTGCPWWNLEANTATCCLTACGLRHNNHPQRRATRVGTNILGERCRCMLEPRTWFVKDIDRLVQLLSSSPCNFTRGP